MAPPRRGGGRSRSLAPPELRGALGSLLRSTLAQASVVRDAIERGAREGRARLDGALSDRRRTEALAALGEIVMGLVQRGRHEELADIPEIADAIAAVEELDVRGTRRDRDDEPGRDWVVPESRSRFDRRDPVDDAELEEDRSSSRRGGDGTVSSKAWQPVRPATRPAERVWRPRVEDVPTPVEPAPEPRRPAPAARGGIVFPTVDDDATAEGEDLAEYMHPDDVPPKK